VAEWFLHLEEARVLHDGLQVLSLCCIERIGKRTFGDATAVEPLLHKCDLFCHMQFVFEGLKAVDEASCVDSESVFLSNVRKLGVDVTNELAHVVLCSPDNIIVIIGDVDLVENEEHPSSSQKIGPRSHESAEVFSFVNLPEASDI